jgi:hypothetical protein
MAESVRVGVEARGQSNASGIRVGLLRSICRTWLVRVAHAIWLVLPLLLRVQIGGLVGSVLTIAWLRARSSNLVGACARGVIADGDRACGSSPRVCFLCDS